MDPKKIIQKRFNIVGRDIELVKSLAVLTAGQHLMLEGSVGTGKTVLATALTKYLGRSHYRVNGDERYTEHKLTGWFDPSSVIVKGYSWETFMPGPLTLAMIHGGILFINELNRLPEGTQNVLLSAMDEHEIRIPKIGEVKAKPGFTIIATQNVRDIVGTSRLSEAIRDRFVWILLEYQPEEEEREIVRINTESNNDKLINVAVRIVKKTRKHKKVRRGASIRGAIDIVKMAEALTKIQGGKLSEQDMLITVAVTALATKIDLEDDVEIRLEKVIEEIVLDVRKQYPENILNPEQSNVRVSSEKVANRAQVGQILNVGSSRNTERDKKKEDSAGR